jgi:hypothetical protein
MYKDTFKIVYISEKSQRIYCSNTCNNIYINDHPTMLSSKCSAVESVHGSLLISQSDCVFEIVFLLSIITVTLQIYLIPVFKG